MINIILIIILVQFVTFMFDKFVKKSINIIRVLNKTKTLASQNMNGVTRGF